MTLCVPVSSLPRARSALMAERARGLRMTLLVPPDCRHYNVAASAEGKKRERTIKTYIRGAWSRTEAKLAFTILAAALCFQFKHSRERDSNAFRLVMVDEMFSKSDDENSRYALELFTRFDFQLLLVTPMEGK